MCICWNTHQCNNLYALQIYIGHYSHVYFGHIPLVQTGLRFNPKTDLRFLAQMLWMVWFWWGCLGNKYNDISVPAKCVRKMFTL